IAPVKLALKSVSNDIVAAAAKVSAGWMNRPSRDGWLLRSSTELVGAGVVPVSGCPASRIDGDPDDEPQPGALAKNTMATTPSAESEAATTTAIQRRFIPAPPHICAGAWPAMPNLFREDAQQALHRIIVPVDDALLERNDRVVGDGDALGTNLGAALGDVAVADAVALLQIRGAVLDVER